MDSCGLPSSISNLPEMGLPLFLLAARPCSRVTLEPLTTGARSAFSLSLLIAALAGNAQRATASTDGNRAQTLGIITSLSVFLSRRTLGRPPRAVNSGRGPAGVAVDEAGANRDADQIGIAGCAELGSDSTAIVGRGLVADAERIGDLRQGTTLGEQPKDFQIAGRQFFQRVRRRSQAGEYERL